MYYPDTVTGAIATSGPVQVGRAGSAYMLTQHFLSQATVNFYQYLEVVGHSLATPPNGI